MGLQAHTETGGNLVVEDRSTEHVCLWWDSKGALGWLFVPVCDSDNQGPCPEDTRWIQGNPSCQGRACQHAYLLVQGLIWAALSNCEKNVSFVS